MGSCKYYGFDEARQLTNTSGGQAFRPWLPTCPGSSMKGEMQWSRLWSYRLGLFGRPARQVDSTRKSLTLAVVCRYLLIIEISSSYWPPPVVIDSIIQMLLT